MNKFWTLKGDKCCNARMKSSWSLVKWGMFGRAKVFLTVGNIIIKQWANVCCLRECLVLRPWLDIHHCSYGITWFTFWKVNLVWMVWFKIPFAVWSIIIPVIFWDDVILAQILLKSVLTFVREQLAPLQTASSPSLHTCI